MLHLHVGWRSVAERHLWQAGRKAWGFTWERIYACSVRARQCLSAEVDWKESWHLSCPLLIITCRFRLRYPNTDGERRDRRQDRYHLHDITSLSEGSHSLPRTSHLISRAAH